MFYKVKIIFDRDNLARKVTGIHTFSLKAVNSIILVELTPRFEPFRNISHITPDNPNPEEL